MIELESFLATVRRRDGKKGALMLPHKDSIKKLIDADVSVPEISRYLAQNGITVTLPTIRLFIRKQFGEAFYKAYTDRNGWTKKKGGSKEVQRPSTGSKSPAFQNPMQNTASNKPASPFDKIENKPSGDEFHPTPDKKKLYGD